MIDAADESLYNSDVMSGTELDAVDHQIISSLREDGRMSFAEIARRLDVSPGTVRERYYRLVQSRLLQVVTVTNLPMMGYRMMALIGMKVDGGRLREIAREIAALDEVIYLVLCTGTYDLLAEVVCRDNADLLKFLTERLHSVAGIHDTQSFVYLDIVKEIYT
jgi:Lrp/AsnC family transcriptional regulator for asnA, asnC and gidA